jgi:hypothetical protein
MTKILTIIDGPPQGDFDNIIDSDDVSPFVTFTTKEEGDQRVRCQSTGVDPQKENDVTVENDVCKVEYNSTNKTGTIHVF